MALVGARQASPYGIMAAGRLGLDLARQGALVVSGMAQGVDAGRRGGGRVVSVLGSGGRTWGQDGRRPGVLGPLGSPRPPFLCVTASSPA